jgi:hypothetical protein
VRYEEVRVLVPCFRGVNAPVRSRGEVEELWLPEGYHLFQSLVPRRRRLVR